MAHPVSLADLMAGVRLEQALALFDDLPPAHIGTMVGQWRGSGVPTDNPFDGTLEALGWYGKRFDSPEVVHPLVFDGPGGSFCVNPAGLPIGPVVGLSKLLSRKRIAAAIRIALRARSTAKPAARMRMVEYRGITSAAMVYDALPIIDHFRVMDNDTLLGAMDLRGVERPLMFLLRRDDGFR